MNAEQELRFYRLYEQLALLTQIVNQKPDIPGIEAILNEIAGMFRLSKGVTHFYRDPVEQQRGEGETMISYDTGKEGKPVHTVCFVTRLMSITTMTVYMPEDEPPLTAEELAKVDLAMRTALAFISRNRLQNIAEELAFYDDMGFRNTRSFYRYLMWRAEEQTLTGTAAVNYNLRHFAIINAEYGRPAGDRVLLNHYQAVREIIGDTGIAARLGKDDFLCIISTEKLPDLLNLLEETEIRYNDSGDTVTISAYAGIFVIPEHFRIQTPGDIMGRIIFSAEVARSGSQGNFVYDSDSILSQKEHSKRIRKVFPSALKNGEFHVFYQPKVNTETGRLCGAEALCRWFHDGKIIPPLDFIPVLEENSEICRLDFYMLDQVCSHIRKWLDAGKRVVRISVNLSRRHMSDAELLRTLIDIIDRHQVPHEYIEIELTETTTDVEFKDLKRVVDGLQEQNICTSVDDFGMGYSSLNLIRAVPWNTLKVDRAFLPLDGEARSSTRSVMFRHVVAMAKELGLECIAEGVETPAQLALLRENACELAQGYLFDKPLPLEEFEKRLDMESYPIPACTP